MSPLGIANTKIPNGIMLAIQMPRLSRPSNLANVYFKASELATTADERHRKSLLLVWLMITLPHWSPHPLLQLASLQASFSSSCSCSWPQSILLLAARGPSEFPHQ